ncbi:hypothetical protein ACYZT3_21620 [Pseudomonas sp. MDT1-16]
MEQCCEIEELQEDFPSEGKAWHQDDSLGPQKRGLCAFVHTSYVGDQEWNFAFSIGMATNEEKTPLIQEIASAGSPLNPKYFIDAENLELWIESELAGLCRYTFYNGDDSDEELESVEPFRLVISLSAVFIRPQYHSLGFGELLNEQLAELMVSGILTRLLQSKAESSAMDVLLTADFESSQGETFFDYLTEQLEFKLELISTQFGVPIELHTDAGY